MRVRGGENDNRGAGVEKKGHARAINFGGDGELAVEATIDDDLAALPDLRLGGKEFGRDAPGDVGNLETVGVDTG